jgi:hypothetical protein
VEIEDDKNGSIGDGGTGSGGGGGGDGGGSGSVCDDTTGGCGGGGDGNGGGTDSSVDTVDTSDASGLPIPAIAGGFAGLLLIVVVAVFVRRQRKRKALLDDDSLAEGMRAFTGNGRSSGMQVSHLLCCLLFVFYLLSLFAGVTRRQPVVMFTYHSITIHTAHL